MSNRGPQTPEEKQAFKERMAAAKAAKAAGATATRPAGAEKTVVVDHPKAKPKPKHRKLDTSPEVVDDRRDDDDDWLL